MIAPPILVDLQEKYGLIAVSGTKASDFLQGQLTCDMREITHNQAGLGAYCNLKGRVRALFRIFLVADVYYIFLPKTLIPSVLAWLKKYAMFSKVELKDVSSDWEYFGLVQSLPNTAFSKNTHVFNLTGENIQNSPEKEPINKKQIVDNNVSDKYSYYRSIIFSPPETISKELPLPKLPAETWNLLDIRAGIPQIWLETTEKYLPHDINLPKLNAVSFNKGCYCGQEIIARMEYRAKLKRGLYYAKMLLPTASSSTASFSDDIMPGTPIFLAVQEPSKKENENLPEPIGTIVSASPNIEKNELEMLIEIPIEYAEKQLKNFKATEKAFLSLFHNHAIFYLKDPHQ